MATLINRDAFARQETHRKRVYDSGTCAWCGNHRTTPKGRKYLFQYYTESDGGRKWDDTRLFDGIDCRRQYYS